METWTREDWETTLKESPIAAYYLYTPMCGTCAVASKMVEVIHTMKPELPIGKADLNYVQSIARNYEIESVPCLLIQKDGIITDKIYAFRSVPYLLEKIS
ncbi:thioredoxin family protein [Sporosarcina limicola]|uniref:Thioredoxin-like negative regulator of GroEL n=1 Tax=Sporosarcina limicola TaxID=34101 RepID=A0A927RGF1_9BACL|nr:thioredoxin family protein [Sporosarcina limicola]MBE1556457.1 thioredoxin-like negative regulator of GroEL [Sporosarcina limicola]